MKKIVTFGFVAATALTLAACGKTEEAPAAEPTAEATEAAPDAMSTEDAAALESAAAAAEGTDPNNNPVPPTNEGVGAAPAE